MAGVRIELLGGFAVRRGPDVLLDDTWPRSRARAILKLLALAPGHRLLRDQVIDAIWPNLSPEAGSDQLYKALHFVRGRAAEAGTDDVVRAIDGRIELVEPIEVDVDTFRHLAREALDRHDVARCRKALDAYAGPLLPNDLLEEWAEPLRRDLAEVALAVRLVELELLEAAGRTAEALDVARETLRIEPSVEPAHRALMRLLAAAGDRAGAIRQYHICRDELRRELDVEPDTETEALHRRILEEGIADGAEAKDAAAELSLIEELGDATRRAGETDRSAVLYEEALGRALRHGDGPAAQRLRGKAALANIVRGDLAAASGHLGSARRAYAGMMPEAYSAALLHYLLAQLRWHGGRYDEALQAAEHAAEAARQTGDVRGEAEACEVLALSCHALGDWRRGIEAELRRQELAVDDGFDVGLALEGHLCLWEYHLYGDRPYGTVEDSVQAALARAEAIGNILAMSVCEHALGALHFVAGRWRDAADELGRSVRLANAVGAELAAIVGMQRLGRLQTAKGDLAEGLTNLELAARAANEAKHPPTPRHSRTRILASLAQNRLQAGDLSAAVAYIGKARAAQSEFGRCVTCDALLGPVGISVGVASGDLDMARGFAAEVGQTALAFGSRAWRGTADLGRAIVLLAEHAAEPAVLAAGRAEASFVEVGQPYDRARSLAVRAAAMDLLGTGAASEAAERIRGEAFELFRSLGADPDPDRLERLLEPA